ncbi:hypothetical protein MMC18_002806 [Xylographa bjoerkii]|nr:hypothetical protein [Xylographa bjoerkii]
METPKLSGPRACGPCAVSKAKCLFASGNSITNGKCKRCNRLNKSCTTQTPAARPHKPRTLRRVAQLEEKLEGLVALLKASPQMPEISGLNIINREPISLGQPPASISPLSYTIETAPEGSSTVEPDLRSLLPRYTEARESITSRHDPDRLLTSFRSNIAGQFPFVVIPVTLNAFELGQDKPFLLKVILMVAAFHDEHVQTTRVNEIMEHLSLHVLMRSEKSLDLLQGLLVLIAWYQSHIGIARRLTVIMQLARSLVVDLGLNKEAITKARFVQSYAGILAFSQDIPPQDLPTLEERRAFLGLTYLNSACVVILKGSDGTDQADYWSSIALYIDFMDDCPFPCYAEACMNVLEESAQYPSDEYLIQLVRLQHIAEEINQALPRSDLESPHSPTAPIALYIRTLQTKLEMFRSRLPIHLQQNPFLLMHYHSVLIFLTETALSIPLPSRQATLHACLTSVQGFLYSLFSIPTFEYYKFTYISWLQFYRTIIVLSKLSSFESDDWDPSHVRGVVDLSLILDGIIARFEELEAMLETRGELDNKNDMFARVIPRLRQYKDGFERKSVALMEGNPLTSQKAVEQPPQLDAGDASDVMLYQLDEAFWDEIVGDWGAALSS